MELTYWQAYHDMGLDEEARRRLATLGDFILGAGFNVTGIREPEEIERVHFLDSLSLLKIGCVASAERIADVGSGGGLPAMVLALALPHAIVTAVESQGKKCKHIEHAAEASGLLNVRVCCKRAEDHGRVDGRGSYDVVVSRAVASLPVLAEYSVPLLRVGGSMVAMKGVVSDQERTQAVAALGILGAGELEMVRLDPFTGSRERSVYLATKLEETPSAYPRRAGVPRKRPLGRVSEERRGEPAS